MRQFVFGYGSLAAELAFVPTREYRHEGFAAELSGFARGWGVAMDNRRDLPGYKFYTAPDGSRPAVCVAFLDVAETSAGSVNGLCMAVEEPWLEQLDRRECNYARVDVSDRIDAHGGRVWMYVGTPAGRERLATAHAAGRAVIDAAYLRTVVQGFERLGEGELGACRESLEPHGLPVLELERHDLADAA
jgi:cation transport regulator ChaC